MEYGTLEVLLRPHPLCFRHKKNREAAVELLMRLKDNRDLQKFLQDCQEVGLPSNMSYTFLKRTIEVKAGVGLV